MTEQLTINFDAPTTSTQGSSRREEAHFSTPEPAQNETPLIFTDDLTPQLIHFIWQDGINKANELEQQLAPEIQKLLEELNALPRKGSVHRKREIKSAMTRLMDQVTDAKGAHEHRFCEAQRELSDRIHKRCADEGVEHSDDVIEIASNLIFGPHTPLETWAVPIGKILTDIITAHKQEPEPEPESDAATQHSSPITDHSELCP